MDLCLPFRPHFIFFFHCFIAEMHAAGFFQVTGDLRPEHHPHCSSAWAAGPVDKDHLLCRQTERLEKGKPEKQVCLWWYISYKFNATTTVTLNDSFSINSELLEDAVFCEVPCRPNNLLILPDMQTITERLFFTLIFIWC